MNSLLVVGSVAFDTVETPAGRRERSLGGSAVYFSVAASHFVAPVRLVAVVGSDFAPAHEALLAGRGIDLAGLRRAEGQTFHWSGSYLGDLNQAVTHATELNVFSGFDPVLPEGWRDSDLLFLANIDPGVQLAVLDQVAAPRLVACDTMNYWIERRRDQLLRVLARTDLLFLNDQEARMLGEDRNVLRAARNVLQLGPSRVVVKRGEHGALLLSGDDLFQLPAFPVERVVDPTGAGDTFAGGFLGWLAAHGAGSEAERPAMAAGSVLASFTVEGFSIERLSGAGSDEIDGRLERLRRMTRF